MFTVQYPWGPRKARGFKGPILESGPPRDCPGSDFHHQTHLEEITKKYFYSISMKQIHILNTFNLDTRSIRWTRTWTSSTCWPTTTTLPRSPPSTIILLSSGLLWLLIFLAVPKNICLPVLYISLYFSLYLFSSLYLYLLFPIFLSFSLSI